MNAKCLVVETNFNLMVAVEENSEDHQSQQDSFSGDYECAGYAGVSKKAE